MRSERQQKKSHWSCPTGDRLEDKVNKKFELRYWTNHGELEACIVWSSGSGSTRPKVRRAVRFIAVCPVLHLRLEYFVT